MKGMSSLFGAISLAERLPTGRFARSFSKKMEALRYYTALDDLSNNFSKYHGSPRMRRDSPQQKTGREGIPKRWSQRTPAMAAGITDHRRSMAELMAYRSSNHTVEGHYLTLTKAIKELVQEYQKDPHHFVWTVRADDILRKGAKLRQLQATGK